MPRRIRRRAAWQAFRQARQRQRERGDDWWAESAAREMIFIAARADDIDGVVPELRAWYPRVETHGLEEDNRRRTEARNFVSACIDMLERESSIGHSCEAEIDGIMRDIAARAVGVLTTDHHAGFRRVRLVRAGRRTKQAVEDERRKARPVSRPDTGSHRFRMAPASRTGNA